ncbi:MAG: polysaccharide biosynthesis/export family protein [Acidobacteriota bacterium]
MKRFLLCLFTSICLSITVFAQGTPTDTKANANVNVNGVYGTAAGPIDDNDYVIGPEDVLTVFVWKEPELTQTLAVRPDGKISLPLLNDLVASGHTTLELKEQIRTGLKQYIAEPTVTVIVQSARSRKAAIIGEVGRPGAYLLNGPTNLLHLISMAGGFRDFAATDKVSVMRQENGKTIKYKFNYREFLKGKNLEQNIELKPGDIVVVP